MYGQMSSSTRISLLERPGLKTLGKKRVQLSWNRACLYTQSLAHMIAQLSAREKVALNMFLRKLERGYLGFLSNEHSPQIQYWPY